MTDGQLSAVVEAGVDTFVCLQESYTEYGCNDYRETLQALARGTFMKSKGFPSHEVSFLHCPMPDFGVIADRDFIALIAELKRSMEDGRTLYIHCYGGHGRTGTGGCVWDRQEDSHGDVEWLPQDEKVSLQLCS